MTKRISREASDATKFKQSLAKQGTNNPNYCLLYTSDAADEL